jgi:hypothetical protein
VVDLVGARDGDVGSILWEAHPANDIALTPVLCVLQFRGGNALDESLKAPTPAKQPPKARSRHVKPTVRVAQ